MADKQPPAKRELPIPPWPKTDYTTKTSKQNKAEEEKQAKNKELDQARDKTTVNIGVASSEVEGATAPKRIQN